LKMTHFLGVSRKRAVIAAALSAVVLAQPLAFNSGNYFFPAVLASEDGGGTPKGQAGASDKGKRGPSGSGATGAGQGGPSPDSDAKGPRFGGDGSKPAPGTQGGKPVWAQEGIPSDLELGRLNVARAPSHVLDRQLSEALATLDPKFYNEVLAIADSKTLTSDEKLAALQVLVKNTFTDDTLIRIDSPLQNLALYKDILTDQVIAASSGTLDARTSTDRLLLLSAVFIGGASDKTISVSAATVDAINKIMTLTIPVGVSASDIATWAEAVRQAIAEAHG
jgi:hypothetical protein